MKQTSLTWKQHFLLGNSIVCALQALVAAVLRLTMLIGNPELPAVALMACPLQHCHSTSSLQDVCKA